MDEVKTTNEGKVNEIVEEVRAVCKKYLTLSEDDRQEVDKRTEEIWDQMDLNK